MAENNGSVGQQKQPSFRIKTLTVSVEIADKSFGDGNSGYSSITAYVDDAIPDVPSSSPPAHPWPTGYALSPKKSGPGSDHSSISSATLRGSSTSGSKCVASAHRAFRHDDE